MRIKHLMLIILSVIISTGLCACLVLEPAPRYYGEHSELETVAINSIPGIISSAQEDDILILETDDYGRKMFAAKLTGSFTIKNGWYDIVVAIIVAQETGAEYVSYYCDINYICDIISDESYSFDLTKDRVSEIFNESDIEMLKTQNDWNKPVDNTNDRYTQIPNSLDKETVLSKKAKETIKSNIGVNTRNVYYRTISSNSTIYFILNINSDANSAEEWYFINLNDEGELANGEKSVYKVNDKDKLSEEMQKFIDSQG